MGFPNRIHRFYGLFVEGVPLSARNLQKELAADSCNSAWLGGATATKTTPEQPLSTITTSAIAQGSLKATTPTDSRSISEPFLCDRMLDQPIHERFRALFSLVTSKALDSVTPSFMVKMLEALEDIEILQDYDDSLDDKYKKLHCDNFIKMIESMSFTAVSERLWESGHGARMKVNKHTGLKYRAIDSSAFDLWAFVTNVIKAKQSINFGLSVRAYQGLKGSLNTEPHDGTWLAGPCAISMLFPISRQPH
ncbi:hypothetical protein SADUNF_Sadunf05G0165500 [Salix dunnii]|uniref:Uncharacterized protein n=1 Tax=Salix dunnii TaxID=1413687 RepID=A0A835K5K1_9ROSI|nr:hypothetical protein SADUNF_Sadunf05G0165500 [Salix dunnii]